MDSVTLTRFFSLHFLLPFVIAGLAIVHVAALHKVGSSNPLAVENADDYIPFYPYFFLKDALLFLIFCFILGWFVFFYPNALSHPDNSIKANPLTTPASIVPE